MHRLKRNILFEKAGEQKEENRLVKFLIERFGEITLVSSII